MVYRPLDPAAQADFISWYGLDRISLDLLRVDGGGRLVLISKELSYVKMSHKQLRQRLVVEGKYTQQSPP